MLNLPDRLETDRLRIQRLKYEDAEEIFYSYASKLEATRFVSWPTHRSIADTNNYLSYSIQAWNSGLEYNYSIRLRDEHRLIGSVGLVNDFGKVQFGYIISPSQWNNGYATEACRHLLDLLKLSAGIYRIWTFVDEENKASSRVLKKLGLVEEARLDNWFRFVNQKNQPKNCILYRLNI